MQFSFDQFDLVAHLRRQQAFSLRTFGPCARPAGVVDHIRRELLEIEQNPGDVKEWIDVVLLALDGAMRSGATAEGVAQALWEKQGVNEHRNWPDWRTANPEAAIEHVRESSGGGATKEAQDAARAAVAAIREALKAYEAAGFGGHVTNPMRSALAQADFSLYEVL